MIGASSAPFGRLICLPYAGGSSLAFGGWSLEPGIELVTVDYPGHLMRPDEKPKRSLEELVAWIAAELAGCWDEPFALCGSSMGALVAFELARTLEASGRAPRAVVLLACPAPSRLPKHAPIAGLDNAGFMRAFAARYGGVAQTVVDDPDTVSMLLPMLRADMELFELYTRTCADPISSDLLAIAGEQDDSAPPQDVAAWADFSRGTTETCSLLGDHFIVESSTPLVLERVRAFVGSRLLPSETVRGAAS